MRQCNVNVHKIHNKTIEMLAVSFKLNCRCMLQIILDFNGSNNLVNSPSIMNCSASFDVINNQKHDVLMCHL